jgi:hypothetical protein
LNIGFHQFLLFLLLSLLPQLKIMMTYDPTFRCRPSAFASRGAILLFPLPRNRANLRCGSNGSKRAPREAKAEGLQRNVGLFYAYNQAAVAA